MICGDGIALRHIDPLAFPFWTEKYAVDHAIPCAPGTSIAHQHLKAIEVQWSGRRSLQDHSVSRGLSVPLYRAAARSVLAQRFSAG